jgi:hypothetical protein
MRTAPTRLRRAARATLALGLLLPTSAPAFQEHAALRDAARELKTARRHLLAAAHDYQGHRDAAVREIDQALAEIRLAIAGVKPSEDERGEDPE